MTSKSKHLLLDIWYNDGMMPLFNFLKLNLARILTKHGQTILNSQEWQFYPHGNTIVFLLASSHASIHTFPEDGYVTIDVYTCDNNFDEKKFMDDFIHCYAYTKCIKHQVITRGIK